MLHLHFCRRSTCTIPWEPETVLLRQPYPAPWTFMPSVGARWEKEVNVTGWKGENREGGKKVKEAGASQEMSEEREVKQHKKTDNSGRLWRSNNCSMLLYWPFLCCQLNPQPKCASSSAATAHLPPHLQHLPYIFKLCWETVDLNWFFKKRILKSKIHIISSNCSSDLKSRWVTLEVYSGCEVARSIETIHSPFFLNQIHSLCMIPKFPSQRSLLLLTAHDGLHSCEEWEQHNKGEICSSLQDISLKREGMMLQTRHISVHTGSTNSHPSSARCCTGRRLWCLAGTQSVIPGVIFWKYWSQRQLRQWELCCNHIKYCKVNPNFFTSHLSLSKLSSSPDFKLCTSELHM